MIATPYHYLRALTHRVPPLDRRTPGTDRPWLPQPADEDDYRRQFDQIVERIDADTDH